MDHHHDIQAHTTARLKRLWRDGHAAYGIWSSIPDTSVAELVAASPADYVCIDLQHGVSTFTELPVLTQVMRGAGRAPIVRVPWKDGAKLMRALDSGAAGVIVPMISSAEEAAVAVAACRFPPHGVRSWGPMWGYVRPDGAPTPAEQDAAALCLVMVETAEAVANLDAIVATPGLDGIYVGPNDLALACGYGRQTYRDSEEVAALVQRIVDACRARGIAVGLHCSDPAMGADWVSRGATMVTIAQDTGLLHDAIADVVAAARGGAAAPRSGPAPY